MNFAVKLAWKYFRGRRKSLARFTAFVAVAGIAAGVASLIVAQALARGFGGEMREKVLAHTAHVTIFKTDGAEIYDWRAVKADLEALENVREVSPTTYESALIVGEKTTGYCVLRATENGKWKTENDSAIQNPQSPDRALTTENSNLITVSVGAELAEKIGLRPGDAAEIMTTANRNEFAPKNFPARVGGVFRTGLYDYDSTWVYVSFTDLNRLYGRADFAPTILTIALEDVYAAPETAARIRGRLSPDFKVVDWRQANEPLFAALGLERKVAAAVISLIIFVAALNITTTLALLTNERRLDIAVLRTCGAGARSLIFIFLLEGVFLGVAGILGGLFSGLAACSLGNRFKIISLPSEVYSLSFVPLDPNLTDVLSIVGATFLLCLLATVYPAWQAARAKPMENLRQ